MVRIEVGDHARRGIWTDGHFPERSALARKVLELPQEYDAIKRDVECYNQWQLLHKLAERYWVEAEKEAMRRDELTEQEARSDIFVIRLINPAAQDSVYDKILPDIKSEQRDPRYGALSIPTAQFLGLSTSSTRGDSPHDAWFRSAPPAGMGSRSNLRSGTTNGGRSLSNYVTAVGIVVAGVWTYSLFIRKGGTFPRSAIKHELSVEDLTAAIVG